MTLYGPIILTLLLATLSPWWTALWRRGFLFAGALMHAAHLACYLNLLASAARGGEIPRAAAPAWFPTRFVEWSFAGTPWGLLFAVMITGIGLLVFLYALGYFGESPKGHRFFAPLLAFEAAMLGVVLADHAVLLFLFWELTSVSSFFLIAHNHGDVRARWNALQALLVTGLGGVCILAGFLLLGNVWGSHSLAAWRATAEAGSVAPVVAMLLILIGAATKSALFPFFFWLPNAMSAPTPVSSYLHSATMVKAGIFLIGALHPLFAAHPALMYWLTALGAVTTATGIAIGWHQTDLKRILAYTTLAVLGLLAFLLGLGSPLAVKVAVLVMIGHACYKAGLFMAAGVVEKAVGSRDLRELGGLGRTLPVLASACLLLALSGAGFPPLLGFLGKEYGYKLGLAAGQGSFIIPAFLFATGTGLMALTLRAAWSPFRSPAPAGSSKPVKSPDVLMLTGPVTLAAASLLLGLASPQWLTPVVNSVVGHVHGSEVSFTIKLWYGFQPALLLGFLTLACGAAVYRFTIPDGVETRAARMLGICEKTYAASHAGLMKGAAALSAYIHNSNLNSAIRCFFIVLLLLVGGKWLASGFQPELPDWSVALGAPVELALVPVLAVFIGLAALTSSRILALLALAVVGLTMAFVFARLGAPDLSLTLLLVETFTIVLFVRIVRGLPRLRTISSAPRRWVDAGIALCAGGVMALLATKAQSVQTHPAISEQLSEWSYALAKGRNVVNVILVDFRALDTLGEITVIALAAVGVMLLWTRPNQGEASETRGPTKS